MDKKNPWKIHEIFLKIGKDNLFFFKKEEKKCLCPWNISVLLLFSSCLAYIMFLIP